MGTINLLELIFSVQIQPRTLEGAKQLLQQMQEEKQQKEASGATATSSSASSTSA